MSVIASFFIIMGACLKFDSQVLLVTWEVSFFHLHAEPVYGTIKCYCSQFLVMYTPNKTAHIWANTGVVKELSFSRLECGVHDKLHISSADWWDLLLSLA